MHIFSLLANASVPIFLPLMRLHQRKDLRFIYKTGHLNKISSVQGSIRPVQTRPTLFHVKHRSRYPLPGTPTKVRSGSISLWFLEGLIADI